MRSVAAARKVTQARLAGVDPKFRAGPNELELESELQVLQPRNAVQHKQMVDMVERLRRAYRNDPAMQNSLALWQGQLLTGQLEDEQKFQFVRRFYWWLLGRGTEADHGKTAWGRANAAVINKEVSLYIEQFAQRRLDFALQLSLLAQRVPTSLLGYWLYFKYIVGGELKRKAVNGVSFWDLSDDNYLADFELFFQYFGKESGGYTGLIDGNQPPDNQKPFDASFPYPFTATQAKAKSIDDKGTQESIVNTVIEATAVPPTAHVNPEKEEAQGTTVTREALDAVDAAETARELRHANRMLAMEERLRAEMREIGTRKFAMAMRENTASDIRDTQEHIEEDANKREQRDAERLIKTEERIVSEVREIGSREFSHTLQNELRQQFDRSERDITRLLQTVREEMVNPRDIAGLRADFEALKAVVAQMPRPSQARVEANLFEASLPAMERSVRDIMERELASTSAGLQAALHDTLDTVSTKLGGFILAMQQRLERGIVGESNRVIGELQSEALQREQQRNFELARQLGEMQEKRAELETEIRRLQREPAAVERDDALQRKERELERMRKHAEDAEVALEQQLRLVQDNLNRAEEELAKERTDRDRHIKEINELQQMLRRHEPQPQPAGEDIPLEPGRAKTKARDRYTRMNDDFRHAKNEIERLSKESGWYDTPADWEAYVQQFQSEMPPDSEPEAQLKYAQAELQSIKEQLYGRRRTVIDIHGRHHDVRGRFVKRHGGEK